MIWALLLMGIICLSLALMHTPHRLRYPLQKEAEEEPMECNAPRLQWWVKSREKT